VDQVNILGIGVTATLGTDGASTDLEEVSDAVDIHGVDGTAYYVLDEYLYLSGRRLAPPWAFSLKHDNTFTPAAAVFSVDGTNLSIEITGREPLRLAHANTGAQTTATYEVTATQLKTTTDGGGGTQTYTLSGYATMAALKAAIDANAGTEGITATVLEEASPSDLMEIASSDLFEATADLDLEDETTNFALATYPTVAEMTAAINAAGINVTAYRGSMCPGTRLTADLELIEDVDILTSTRHAFFNPELDDDMMINIVLEVMLERQMSKDNKPGVAAGHRKNAEEAINMYRIEYENQFIAAGNRQMKEIYETPRRATRVVDGIIFRERLR
jgi:hypothetical protein